MTNEANDMELVRNTTEKDTFWANVEFNVSLLKGLVAKFEAAYNSESDLIKKTSLMMLLLDAENQLDNNIQLLG